MYVSFIEIEGFKSFAEKTVIPLNKNLNIIIGPNGSGKSNIIDAISFVLGESSRHLRADKGVNLIYKGVKNVNKASVSLVIDLEDDYPKKIFDYFDKELIKDNKVILTRVIKKSGESNYLINGQRVNKSFFNEILSLLRLNTPYNIIFQGDITNIVKSSPFEKRRIFEELVNINYFEQKKEKVKKELEEVQLRLNEFIAILREKEKQYEDLKKEKEEAEKFLELEKRKKILIKKKYEFDLKEFDKKINEINNSIIALNTKLSQISLAKKNLKQEIDSLNQKIEEINEKIRLEGGKDIQKLEKEREELIKEIERTKTELENLSNVSKEIIKEIEELEEKKRSLMKEIIKNEKELSILKRELLEKEKNLSDFNLEDLNLESIEKEINALKEEISNLKNRKLMIKEKLKDIDFSKNEDIEKSLKELQNKESSLAVQMNEIKRLIEEKERKLIELKSKYEEQISEINQDKLISKILDLKKEIEGIYGPLFMLGNVNEEYKLALEMAAGPRLRAIVVENEDVAKKIIEILRKEKIGVANFIPLNRIKEKNIQVPNFPGVVDRADKLINYDKKFEKAFKYVFGDTIVVESFEIAKKIGIGRFRMVTLKGELFETTGVISGGYLKRRQSFIDNSLEEKIRNLELEISSLKERLEEIKKERELLAEKIFELRLKKKEEEKKKEIISNLDNLKRELEEIEKKLKEKEEDLRKKEEDYKEKREKLSKYLENIKEREKIIKEISKIKEKIVSLEEKTRFNKENLEETEKKLSELYKKDNEISKKNLELKEIQKEKEEKLNNIEKELNKLSEKLKKLFLEKEGALKEVNKKNNELIKIEEEIQEIEKIVYQKELKKQMLIEERENIVRLKNEIEEEIKEDFNIKDLKKLLEELKKVEEELSKLKNVNIKSIEKFKLVEEEYNKLKERTEKIKEERDKILNIIAEIEEAKKREFMKAFDSVNNNFRKIYQELLEKGEAWLELTNKEDPFSGGVEIKVKIANKTFDLKSLSGGEQSLVALSLIFAIQEYKPGTFYVFDEVDAALDKRNSRKLAKYLRNYSKRTQFIIISHNEEVIIEADYLFGVSMNKKTGISKLVALDLSDKKILEKIKTS